MEIIKLKNTKNGNNLLSPVSIEGTKIILHQMESCICNIYMENLTSITGFFMKIPYKSNNLPVLITSSTILEQKKTKDNNYIELTLNDDKIYREIDLNKKRKIYKNLKFKIVVIEIYPLEDKINNYLELDEKNVNGQNNLNNTKSIFSLYYSNEKSISVSYGLLMDIISNDIKHTCNVDKNSLGSPILSLENFKVIGINKGIRNNDINLGFNINYLIQEFNNQFNEIDDDLNELTIKYLINDKDDKIKIFDETFVNNNKENCILNLFGNEIDLIDYISKEQIKGNNQTLEIKLKKIKKITNMSSIFYNCKSLLSFDFSKWDTSKVTNMSCLFYNCSSLSYLPDISNWDTSKVTDISCMFYYCSSLVSLPDISKWNTNNIKYPHNLFDGCKSLLSLPDISKWNTNNFTGMGSMFRMCSSLKFLPDISKWNTNKVVNFAEMFNGCKSLSSLPDISKWNTNNVVNMIGMFSECSSLFILPDISKWNTSKVWNMNGLFYKCNSLSCLPKIQNWNMNKVTKKYAMFHECHNLVKIPPI